MPRKWDKIYMDCMTEIYENATPRADFAKLIEQVKQTGEKDEFGRFIFPFNDYEIDGEKLTSIFQKYVKKYRLKKWEECSFGIHVYLGVSPKIKYNETNN